MKTKKKILFSVCTHGDEAIGLWVVRQLKRTSFSKNFDFVIANPVAFAKNMRFVDCDLNRCAPGDLNAIEYEKRRAAELIALAKQYDYVIDLHGSTNKQCGIFIIICKPTRENLLLASWLDIKNIVVWVGEKNKSTGPWTQFIGATAEIECGDKDNKNTVIMLDKKLRGFLKRARAGNLDFNLENNLRDKNLFIVVGKIQDENYKEKLFDFQIAKYKDEEFYPILSGQYPGINCYKMKKVTSIEDALNPWAFMEK